MSNYAIYCLKDPRDGAIRYVGQTTNIQRRASDHARTGYCSNTRKMKWTRELSVLGLEPTLEVLEHCEPGQLMEREREWCRMLSAKGCELLNMPASAITRKDLISPDLIGEWHADISEMAEEAMLLGCRIYKHLGKSTSNGTTKHLDKAVAALGNAKWALETLIEERRRLAELAERKLEANEAAGGE